MTEPAPTPADIAPHVQPVPVDDDAAPQGAPAPEDGGIATDRLRARLARKSHIADGVPVVAFTGVNGAGKTLLAASCAVQEIARGNTVYSTVPITSPWGDAHPIKSLRQLLEVRNSILLLDEIAAILSSTSSSSLPPEFSVLLQTLRHSGNTVWWTAPQWMRANNQLRLATQGLVNVHPLLRSRDARNPWSSPRLIMAGLMDTSSGKADSEPTKVLRRRVYAPSRLPGWGAYDTHADTPYLGMRPRSGACPDCGGDRPRVKCSPDLHDSLGVPWFGN